MERPAARSPLTGDDWRRITELADRLEAAWSQGDAAALGPLLPSADDPLRPAALCELIKTDLEIRWAHGRPAMLENYLEEFPELGARPNDALAELLYEEYRVRRRHGAGPPLESYQARFPGPYDLLRRIVKERPLPTQAGAAPVPAAPPAVSVSVPMESNRLLPIGGGYVLETLIGRGGFGEVWRAAAPGGVLVAVKIIRRPADHEERVREERALEVVKQLHHHFLAKTHQYHSDKESLYIVMELADCSLRDKLREARKANREGLPVEELAPLMREAGEALDYLHAKGVLHRDIKPDNILLVENHVRLADFGLARLQDQKMMSVSGSGTFAYMAPEVWGGKASAMSDQYSLAYTYAELRLGRRPFNHSDFASLMFDHINQTPDLAPMPEAEQRVVLQALAKSPDHRFPSCLDFARALERFADDVLSTPTHKPEASVPAARETWQPAPAPLGTQLGFQPSARGSTAADEEHEPRTRSLDSLSPHRTPPSERGASTEEGPPTARTERTPPSPRPMRPRRPWGGFVAFLAVVALGTAAFVAWLNYPGGNGPTPAPAASITLVAPPPLVLRPGDKQTVNVSVQRKNCPDAVKLTATTPLHITVAEATIPAGADSVAVEVVADSNAENGESKIHLHGTAGGVGGDVELSVTVSSTPGPPSAFLPPGFKGLDTLNGGFYPRIAIDRSGWPATEFVLLGPQAPGDPPPFYLMKTKASNALVAALRGGATPAAAEAGLPAFHLTAAEARTLAAKLSGLLPTTAQYDRAAGFNHREGRDFPATASCPHADVGRIDGGPIAVDDPADDDVTPEGVRGLCGNGTEFTRNLIGGRTAPPDVPAPGALVILRGWTFAAQRAMTYADLEFQQKTPQVQYERAAGPYTGFRVVIEPPNP